MSYATEQMQDWVNVVLGVWLAISPWALGFTGQQTAATVAWVTGVAVALFAGIGAYMQEAWEEAINVILGVILIGAPWAFDFADARAVTTNIAGTGAVVMVLAIWAMLQDMDIKTLKEGGRHAPGTR